MDLRGGRIANLHDELQGRGRVDGKVNGAHSPTGDCPATYALNGNDCKGCEEESTCDDACKREIWPGSLRERCCCLRAPLAQHTLWKILCHDASLTHVARVSRAAYVYRRRLILCSYAAYLCRGSALARRLRPIPEPALLGQCEPLRRAKGSFWTRFTRFTKRAARGRRNIEAVRL